jgi:hypothetical protein
MSEAWMESGDGESWADCGIQLLKIPTDGMDHGPLRSRFHRIEDVVEESSELASVERRGESLQDSTSVSIPSTHTSRSERERGKSILSRTVSPNWGTMNYEGKRCV